MNDDDDFLAFPCERARSRLSAREVARKLAPPLATAPLRLRRPLRAFAAALLLSAGAAGPALAIGPLHERMNCPHCSGGFTPPAGLGGEHDESDPEFSRASRFRAIEALPKTRPLPASVTAASRSAATASGGAEASAPSPAPPPAGKTAAPVVIEAPSEFVSGYAVVAFRQLAGFAFTPPAGQPLAKDAPVPDVLRQVPEIIRRLDGKKVLVTGFMLPTKMENGFATEFFLLSIPMFCCYGVVPAPTEWIHVKMRKEGLPAVQDVPMPVAGRLRVRAQWQDGLLTGIYELDGDGLLKPKR